MSSIAPDQDWICSPRSDERPGSSGPEASSSGTDSGETDFEEVDVQCLSEQREASLQNGRKGNAKQVRVYLNTRYPIFSEVAQNLGFSFTQHALEASLAWCDEAHAPDYLGKLFAKQRVNHIPGMYELGRKDCLAKNIYRMSRKFPNEYSFFPKTWIMPHDFEDFIVHYQNTKKKNGTYIYKPDRGSRGNGIELFKADSSTPMRFDDGIVQSYICRPLLINNMKFDMRIYVLVTSVDPELRIYLHEDGLARFCTTPYQQPNSGNLSCSYMHLTNYAINKTSHNFKEDGDAMPSETSSKWSLSQLKWWMYDRGYNWKEMWSQVEKLVVLTLASISHDLQRNYRLHVAQENDGFSCFDLLGFDVILEHDFTPKLLEVNLSPSFHIDTKVDRTVKTKVVTDTIRIVNPKPFCRAKHVTERQKQVDERLRGVVSSQEQKEKIKERRRKARGDADLLETGGFKMIYPCRDEDRDPYADYMTAHGIFHETKSSSFRKEYTREKTERWEKMRDEKLAQDAKNWSKQGLPTPVVERPPPTAPADVNLRTAVRNLQRKYGSEHPIVASASIDAEEEKHRQRAKAAEEASVYAEDDGVSDRDSGETKFTSWWRKHQSKKKANERGNTRDGASSPVKMQSESIEVEGLSSRNGLRPRRRVRAMVSKGDSLVLQEPSRCSPSPYHSRFHSADIQGLDIDLEGDDESDPLSHNASMAKRMSTFKSWPNNRRTTSDVALKCSSALSSEELSEWLTQEDRRTQVEIRRSLTSQVQKRSSNITGPFDDAEKSNGPLTDPNPWRGHSRQARRIVSGRRGVARALDFADASDGEGVGGGTSDCDVDSPVQLHLPLPRQRTLQVPTGTSLIPFKQSERSQLSQKEHRSRRPRKPADKAGVLTNLTSGIPAEGMVASVQRRGVPLKFTDASAW